MTQAITNYNNSNFNRIIKIYDNGGSLVSISDALLYSARRMIEKAKLIKNIDSVLATTEIIHHLLDDSTGILENEVRQLSKVMFSNYEHIVDDMIIISSYEMYAKAVLLRKRYIVHEIIKPNNIRRKQKKNPYHILTYRSDKKNNNDVSISQRTITVSTLLNNKYTTMLGLTRDEITFLKELNLRRNLCHLFSGDLYGLEPKKVKAIKKIYNRILSTQ